MSNMQNEDGALLPGYSLSFGRRMWMLIYPMLVYYGATMLVSFAAGMVYVFQNMDQILGLWEQSAEGALGFGSEAMTNYMNDALNFALEYSTLLSFISYFLTIPLLAIFRRKDKKRERAWNFEQGYGKADASSYLLPLVAGATLAVALNNLLYYSRLMELLYDGYESTAEVIYNVPAVLRYLLYGLISPLTEELLFRGIIFRRMKWSFPAKAALLISSVYFGFFHGNVLQAVYAGLLGIFFAWVYEKYHDLLAAFLAHAGANLLALAFSDSEALNRIYENEPVFLVVTAGLLIICGGAIYIMITRVNVRKNEPETQQSATETAEA